MSATVTVGGNVLGVVFLDRTESEEAKTLGVSLDSAERILDVVSPASGTEPPKIGDRGKGLATLSMRAARDFDTPDEAALWLLDIADERGYAGAVKFTMGNGAEVEFPYGVATPAGGRQVGGRVEIGWRLVLGRKLE